MREILLILGVLFVLLALTAIRYRKQISGMIGVAKMLKDVKNAAAVGKRIDRQPASVHLVNCSKCGVWIAESKAQKSGAAYACLKC